ncbi:(2Fe-2S)-binding protein [Streptomyces sp. NPDC049577]|uniref:(2Fe-2S)-binding protein n=1 Tax=Streptomyces sp. NPDC049577 TaxID=3155153 RepID=UPI0034424BA1
MDLSELSAVGPFFALRTGDMPDTAGYLPLDGTAVGDRVRTVGERLGTADRRVAASVAFQGIAGRLLSIALGAAVLTGQVPDLTDERLRWHTGRTAPEDLWLARPAALPADRIAPGLLYGRLSSLHTATRAVTPLFGRLLWGNAASSLAGAARMLRAWCLEQGRPREAERTAELTRALFADPLLRGTGTLRTRPDVSFARRSCCLYYRVPAGGLCGDCVLRHPPRGRRAGSGGH